jgi:hypothetical protein
MTMAPPFTKKFPMWVGDTKPYLQVQILNPDGTPRDLTGQLVQFNMGLVGQPRKINLGVVTLVVASQGIVEYRWVAGDTNTDGDFRATFVVNGSDTYPKDSFILVPISTPV